VERHHVRVPDAAPVHAQFPKLPAGECLRRGGQTTDRLRKDRGVPWGISESAHSALDSHKIYQYRAFGVPSLGLKRGLEEDLVVAPYATALALLVSPAESIENLKRLVKAGMYGRMGFYESLDYTRQEERRGGKGVVVYAYMAHHQGMSLMALNNVLNRGIMRRRFHADRRIKADGAVAVRAHTACAVDAGSPPVGSCRDAAILRAVRA
jgi:hypothetical protein